MRKKAHGFYSNARKPRGVSLRISPPIQEGTKIGNN
jgi:hypothetical protein